jgi:hypothetical protein
MSEVILSRSLLVQNKAGRHVLMYQFRTIQQGGRVATDRKRYGKYYYQ